MATAKKIPPAAAVPDVAAAAPEKKPKSRMMLILMLSILIAAGAGGGGWFYLQHKNAEAKSTPAPEKKKPPVFLPIDQFTVNLTGNGGDHFLQISFSLEVSDSKVVDEIKQRMPVVRSRLLLLLASKTAEELGTSEGKQKLIGELLTEARAPLPATENPSKGIENLHFSALVIQ